jgi:sulfonate transport system permease protein
MPTFEATQKLASTSERRTVRASSLRATLVAARRYVFPILVIAAWELAARFGGISPYLMPSPSTILATITRLSVSGELPYHLLVSTVRVCVGLCFGMVVGTTLGLISGLSRLGEDMIDSSVQMLRTIPHLAIAPLFIIWFGIDEAPKILLIALGVTFYIYINLFAGIRTVDKKIIEAGQTLGLTRAEQIRWLILPGAMPSYLVGLRYAIGMAWLSLVVGEQINAKSGIGYLISTAREFGQTDVIFVGLIVYAALGLLTDILIRRIEQRAFRWRPQLLS